MAAKRVTAEFVYTLTDAEPIRNGYVEYDDQTERFWQRVPVLPERM